MIATPEEIENLHRKLDTQRFQSGQLKELQRLFEEALQDPSEFNAMQLQNLIQKSTQNLEESRNSLNAVLAEYHLLDELGRLFVIKRLQRYHQFEASLLNLYVHFRGRLLHLQSGLHPASPDWNQVQTLVQIVPTSFSAPASKFNREAFVIR
jgi:hypothetical protein